MLSRRCSGIVRDLRGARLAGAGVGYVRSFAVWSCTADHTRELGSIAVISSPVRPSVRPSVSQLVNHTYQSSVITIWQLYLCRQHHQHHRSFSSSPVRLHFPVSSVNDVEISIFGLSPFPLREPGAVFVTVVVVVVVVSILSLIFITA